MNFSDSAILALGVPPTLLHQSRQLLATLLLCQISDHYPSDAKEVARAILVECLDEPFRVAHQGSVVNGIDECDPIISAFAAQLLTHNREVAEIPK